MQTVLHYHENTRGIDEAIENVNLALTYSLAVSPLAVMFARQHHDLEALFSTAFGCT